MESDVVPGLQQGATEAGSVTLWTTLLQADLPFGRVELIDYDLQAPLRHSMSPRDNFIELLLIEHHVDRRAWLSHMPGSYKLGDIVFFMPDQVVEIDWPAIGRLRAVRCSFRSELAQPRPFTPEERRLALDIRSPVIRKAMHAISDELLSPGFQSPVLLNSLSGQIAVELGRYFRRRNSTRPARKLNTAQLKLVDERIEAGGNLPTAAEMAERCQLSKRHFFRLFRLTTGMSLADYAGRRRIERAKELLRRENMVVKQVAFRCGFRTPSGFSAAFRQVTGMTPREYRLKAGGQS